MPSLLQEIRSCTICTDFLPNPPKPVLNFSLQSKIMIVGQAPGIRVHNTGIPWNDPSGERLRECLQVDRETFYDPQYFAIVPMGFCYPGRGKTGDLPPRPECAAAWMEKIRKFLKNIKLTVLIGKYAQAYYLENDQEKNLTETVKNWKHYLPNYMVLPHPSPRNNIWLRKNEWFEKQVIPELRKKVHAIIQ